ncbi:MAG TPA: AraC family transcriptional regulator [Polyangiaceae bacterium]|nr:AraC family transcriptional regulator [Polyangiaceae bacterium]
MAARRTARRGARSPNLDALAVARATLGPRLANVFQELGVSATLTDGTTWDPIHSCSNVLLFELSHGVERRRDVHNVESLARTRRTGRSLLASHAGFYDLFVPIEPGADTVLVVGPFSLARPTSSDLQDRWRWLAGTQARATDPEFSHYLTVTLATATFEGPLLEALTQFAESFCRLLSGRDDAESIALRASALRAKLANVRFVERSFLAAAEMVDERTSQVWTSPHWVANLRFLGAERLPSHAIVGLVSGRADELDAIDQMLRCDAFQRGCAELARKLGGVVCGKVGDSGVALLVEYAGKGARAQAKLLELADRAHSLGRRLGLSAHFGISDANTSAALPARYEAALAASENALSNDQRVVMAAHEPRRVLSPLGDLRRELARSVGAAPGTLRPRFDRYLDAVTARSGYRLEPMRAHVEAGFDRIVEALRATGAIDDKSLTDLRDLVERAADAKTVPELMLTYRRAVLDVEQAVSRPKEAQHDRSLRRATSFIREHFGEPLPLSRVARVAGFAPTYFSSIFAKSEKTTLPRYIKRVRVERAKKMLESTAFGIERIGQLCGFRTRSSFHAAFHELARSTPGGYRIRVRRLANSTTRKR